MSLIPWKNKSADEASQLPATWTSLRSDMDRLFDAFVREPFGAIDWSLREPGTWSPAVDVAENEAEYVVRAELPGLDPKELDISVTENQLVLSGEKKETIEKHEKGYHRTESRYGSFRRCVALPGAIDSAKVEAEFKNGVLTVHLAKSPETATKRIEVKVKEEG